MSSGCKETLIRILAGLLCFFLTIGNMNQPTIRAEEILPEAEEQKVLECRFTGHTHTNACYKDGKLICGMSTEYFHTHSEACYDDHGELICPLQERNRHRHTEACYTRTETLTCGLEEGEGGHQHTDACNTLVRAEEPACGLEETDGHIHGEECLADCLICGLGESAGHVHTDECLKKTLTCKLEESDGHVHGVECRDTEGNLICGLEETEGHRHTDECYTTGIACGKEEGEGVHVHSEQCYEHRLVCEKDEIPAHHHTEKCYPEVRTLTCGLEETEGHIHTPDCYETTEKLTCQYAGIHEHTDACFETDENGRRICICGYLEMPEHRHNESCFRVMQTEDEANPEDGGDIQGVSSAKDEATDDDASEDGRTEETDPEEGNGTEETDAVAELNNTEDIETIDSETVEAEEKPLTMPVVLMQADEMECIATDEDMPVLFAAEYPGMEGEESGTVSAGDEGSIYNAYEKGLLPAVRNQGDKGTCWVFASIGSVEACLIAKNLAGTDVDLSELHLAYFTAHPYADPKNGNTGDTVEYQGGESYLDNGGNEEMAYRAMENMVGLVNESDAPYTDKDSYQPDAAEAMNKDAVQLVGAYLINPKDMKNIKNAIKTYGAVCAGIYAQAYTYYNNTYNSYYSTIGRTNHTVMLVGWNDNYPATNFNEAYRPGKNGAWLARNSWGCEGYAFSGYFWLSYEDVSLMSNESLNAYDAEYKTYDYCYAYDSTPAPEAKHEANQTATVSQKFRVDGGETIQAVGFETGTANLTASISLTDGSTTVTGSKKTTFAGFYLVKLSTPLAVNSTKEVSLTITYTGSGKIRIMSEAVGRNTTGNIVYTGAMGGQGFTLNGTHYDEDARMKLYTTKTGGSGLIEVSSVTLDKSSLTMEQSTTAQLTATVLPSNASNQEITWSSSDTQVATVDSNGLVTSTPYGGEATITAMARNGEYATCKVKVNVVYVPVESVAIQGFEDRNPFIIDPATYPDFDKSIPMWLEYKLLPARATNKDVSWSSSNTNVATVDKDGKVFFKNNGTVTISITASDGKKDQVTIQISAIRVPVTSVEISDPSVTLTEGDQKQLKATVYPADATDKTVTWSSSDMTVATVSDKGEITAVKAGNAVITAATNEKDGTRKASCIVTVQAKPTPTPTPTPTPEPTPVPTSPLLSFSAMSFQVKGDGTVTATVTQVNGEPVVDGTFVFCSGSVPVATVQTGASLKATVQLAPGTYRVGYAGFNGYWEAIWDTVTVPAPGPLTVTSLEAVPDTTGRVDIQADCSGGVGVAFGIYGIYSGNTLLESFTTTESTVTWQAPASGIYVLQYVAFDGVTWAARWSTVTVRIVPVPPFNVTGLDTVVTGDSIRCIATTNDNRPVDSIFVLYQNGIEVRRENTKRREAVFTGLPKATFAVQYAGTDGKTWDGSWTTATVGADLRIDAVTASRSGNDVVIYAAVTHTLPIQQVYMILYNGAGAEITRYVSYSSETLSHSFSNVKEAKALQFTVFDGVQWSNTWVGVQ